MTKKILILVDKPGRRKSQIAKFIQENIKDSQVTIDTLSDFVFELNDGLVDISLISKNKKLDDFNLVYFLRAGQGNIALASAVAYYLETKNIKFIDANFKEIGAAGSKLTSLLKLSLGNIPIPPSIYISRKRLLAFKSKLIEKFGFPILSKNMYKQRREGLFLIEKASDFEKLLDIDNSRGFIFQKIVKIKTEYRVVVMGGLVAAAHKEASRRLEGNRIIVNSRESQSGFVNPEGISVEIKDLAIKATKILNLDISGADIALTEERKIIVFEVNRSPGFTLNTKASPELPELAKYLDKLTS